jgi:hypothetical protein
LHAPEIDYALDRVSVDKTYINDSMDSATVELVLDGAKIKANKGEWLVDAITREKDLPHICYHPRTESAPVRQAQLEAMDVILGNHLLYARSATTTMKIARCITRPPC